MAPRTWTPTPPIICPDCRQTFRGRVAWRRHLADCGMGRPS